MSFLSGSFRTFTSGSASSSSRLCTSASLSRLIFASCDIRKKPIIWLTGTFSCPIMNCTASIIPRVMSFLRTAVAATIVMRTLVTSFIKVAPADWYWIRLNPFTFSLNRIAWSFSQSHRMLSSLCVSFISCMPFTILISLLPETDICLKRWWSSRALDFIKRETQTIYNADPARNNARILLL